ncbi:hypothetical protein VW29_16465 [Devosia limi DSM 17137]|nr:hypothetical protein VW29_16465 [Devosia limi DSM 17137]
MAAAVLVVLALASPVFAQQVTDYLGVPGPITFNGTDYALSWSSKPTPDYIKQEYLPRGQVPEAYSSMLMVEFLAGDLKPTSMAGAQMDLLNRRKASDPLVSMALTENAQSGEVILDFILSGRDETGGIVVEWNAYRYAQAQTAAGKTGGMLLAISRRAYGEPAARAFLASLQDLKAVQVPALAAAELPKF